MKHSLIKKQKGVGLIEVLITTVVVAVGLLAVASLQGDFMSSSGESKIRAEALELAQQKLEQFNNTVALAKSGIDPLTGAASIPPTDFNTLLTVGTDTDRDANNNPITIQGKNADFTRTWVIQDIFPTPAPPFTVDDQKRKRVSVQVGWDGNGDGDVIDAEETVNVVTELAWNDPSKALRYAQQNTPGFKSVASPRQNASEDAAAETVIGTDLAITDLDLNTIGAAGVDATLQVTIPPSGSGSAQTITLTQVAKNSHYYTAIQAVLNKIEAGVIAVFLCSDADNNSVTPDTCTHIQNHFGGVVHRISGAIHSTSSNDLNDIRAVWSSSEVTDCYNGKVTVVSGSGTDQYRYRPYECVFAGNCDQTADNVNGCNFGVTDAQIALRNVGPGGEYGGVGLEGVSDSNQGGHDREQVCFLEDTTDPATSPLLDAGGGEVMNEDYMYAVTKRAYEARRIKRASSINEQKTEGINHSYTNHNYLLVSRGTGNTANQICNLKAAARAVQLAPREIFHTLNENILNQSLAESAYTGAVGTAKTLTGTVTGNATNLKLMIPGQEILVGSDLTNPSQGSCYLDNNTDNDVAATAYACAVPSGTASVAIKGGSDEHLAVNPSAWASCIKSDVTTCNWTTNFTALASGCTAPWGDIVPEGSSVTAYQNAVEPFGSVVVPPATCPNTETRTCTTGVLSGSFTNQTCTVAAGSSCTTPWGTTLANGTSTQAYTFASVPYGQTCPSATTRNCNNGILDGTGNFASCTPQTTRDITVTVAKTGTGSLSTIVVSGSGAICVDTATANIKKCTVDGAWTGTLSATATCSGSPSTVNGTSPTILVGDSEATITMADCTGPVCSDLPWKTVDSGQPVVAVASATVAYPNACSSETRFCEDGVLSGSYTVEPPCTVICTVPNLIGMSTNSTADKLAVTNAITAAGFTVGAATDIGHGAKQVSEQNPPAGSTPVPVCGSAITYSYN